jgi:hypothetical protein
MREPGRWQAGFAHGLPEKFPRPANEPSAQQPDQGAFQRSIPRSPQFLHELDLSIGVKLSGQYEVHPLHQPSARKELRYAFTRAALADEAHHEGLSCWW